MNFILNCRILKYSTQDAVKCFMHSLQRKNKGFLPVVHSFRLCSGAQSVTPKPEDKGYLFPDKREVFTTIYKKPNVAYFSLFSKVTFLPSVLCATSLPISGLLWGISLIDVETTQVVWLLATWMMTVLQLPTFHIWKTVGYVYVNEDRDKVKISYIGYRGKRQDIVASKHDVLFFSDVGSRFTDLLYKSVKVSGIKGYLKLFPGEVTDKEIFIEIFGEIGNIDANASP